MEEEIKYNREGFIKVLEEHFGKVIRDEHTDRVINFGKSEYTLKEIGNIAEYTPDQFNRHINPREGEEPKEAKYREAFIRTKFALKARELQKQNTELEQLLDDKKQLLENRLEKKLEEKYQAQLEAKNEQIKEESTKKEGFKIACISIALVLAALAFRHLTYKPKPVIETIVQKEFVRVETPEAGLLLSKAQRNEVIEWHAINIQQALAVEGLIFSMNLRDSTHTVEKGLETLINRTYNILINSQKKIRNANFIVDNGQNLAELFVRTSHSSKEKLREHYKRILHILTNEQSAYRQIADDVMLETRKVQDNSKITLDSIIDAESILKTLKD